MGSHSKKATVSSLMLALVVSLGGPARDSVSHHFDGAGAGTREPAALPLAGPGGTERPGPRRLGGPAGDPPSSPPPPSPPPALSCLLSSERCGLPRRKNSAAKP